MLPGRLINRVNEPGSLASHCHIAENNITWLHADFGAVLRTNIVRHPPTRDALRIGKRLEVENSIKAKRNTHQDLTDQ